MKKTKNAIYQNINYVSDDFKILISKFTSKHVESAFHEPLEIKYFYEGSSMMMIDSDMIVAEKGDIVITNPFEVHSNITGDACAGKYYILMVDLDFFADNGIFDIDLRQMLLVNGQRFNRHIRNNERLQQLILRAKEELDQKKEYYKTIVKSIMCEFFSLLLRDELESRVSDDLNKDVIKRNITILPALQKIFCDYRNHITVDELAKLCNISKYHFCRVFKQQMGVTVFQYIVKYRISVAAMMLNTGNYSIGEVASMCGFEDISYFYRCYKRINGMAPHKVK